MGLLADLVLFFQELVNYQPGKIYLLVWFEGWSDTVTEGMRLVFITGDIASDEIEQIL